MAEWTTGQNKALGWFYFVVALVAIVIALIQAPIGEWGTFGVIIGIAVAALGIVGLRQGLTGKGNTRSRNMSESKQRVWAIVGLIGISVAAVGSIIGNAGEWSAADTLTLGAWVALIGLFITQIRTLSKT